MSNVHKLSMKDMKSTDGKVGYSNPGCFNRNLTAFHFIDSFTTFNSYAFPAPGSFECEFFHYLVAFASEIFTLQYTYFPGLDHFPESKITNPCISADQISVLKRGYENTLNVLYEKYGKYKETIDDYKNIPDEELAEDLFSSPLELTAGPLETSGLELLIACFNHIVARIFVTRTLKSPDPQTCKLTEYAEAILATSTFGEQVNVFKKYEFEKVNTLLKKNIFDMNVYAYIEAKMKNIPDEEALKLLGSTPLYLPAIVQDVFFDLVVYIFGVVTRPEYVDALVKMNEKYVQEIPEIKRAQSDVARANIRKYEELKKHSEVAIEDEEFTKTLNPPVTNLNTDNALKWFMSKTENEIKNDNELGDPYMRHNTYNTIKRMIEEILDRYLDNIETGK